MPGNHMTFPGVPDEKTRKSIIAFLRQTAEKPADGRTTQPQMSGMPGMQRLVPNLKAADASSRIKTITYCHDTFKVTTTDGKLAPFGNAIFVSRRTAAKKGQTKTRPRLSTRG